MSEYSREQLEHIEAAILHYSKVKTGRAPGRQLVPIIRRNLHAAGVDASVLDISGRRPADAVERELTELEAQSGRSRGSDNHNAPERRR